jgi:hypothetical protein
MRSLRQLAASGFLRLADNPTLLPDERDHLYRRFCGEHRRVSNQNPTTTNTLLMPDTPAIVGFVRLYEKV